MKFDIHCKDCKRYITYTENSINKMPLKCAGSKCKQTNLYTITFMSDLILNGHSHAPKEDNHEKQIAELEDKLSELDGRTKEAKELKAELENLQSYVTQLEGIIDGQG